MRVLITSTDNKLILLNLSCVQHFERTGKMVLHVVSSAYDRTPPRYSTSIRYEEYSKLLGDLLLYGYADWSHKDFKFDLLE